VTQLVDDSLDAGRAAAQRHAWREAYDLLRSSDEPGRLTAEDMVALAEAAWWTGHLDEAIALRERAYAAYSESGNPGKAAQMALNISMDQMTRGAMSVSAGWRARAERLLEPLPENPGHGYLALARGLAAQATGDMDGVGPELARARELGSRFGDRNLESLAQVFEGTYLVSRGDVTQGLALLDEATAAAVSGELEPLATGIVYCVTIDSCQLLGDCGRAVEWSEAANRWCDRLDVTGFPGACRIHGAEILRLRGDWPKAEEQAVQACEELNDYNRFVTAAGFYEIGEIRRRRGDFAAAEEAYRKANEAGHPAQPGLALLRLAQGKVEAAATALKRELAELEDPLLRARRLPGQVEISLAAGEIARAREAAEELESIADRFGVDGKRTPAREGAVRLAWGRIHLAEHDWDRAAAELRAARETWDRVGAPYEVAEARLHLGLAYRGEGDEEGAREELLAARAAFERLGAALDLQRAMELLGESAARRTFMFTDMVDSTKLVEALGDEKWSKLLAWHDRRLRELIEEAGGEVIKHTGDGYFAAFQSSSAALDAAAGIQRALEEHEPFAPDVRIGIHTGGAFHRDGEGDYAGQGVNMAARIGALAGGGEILVSSESLDGGSRYPLSDRRAEQLKGFEEPVELVAVGWR
jgi:class 3 adenylate cyclase/tetratricopeptide (TPR) repeat protein